jgi:hypothetical protein
MEKTLGMFLVFVAAIVVSGFVLWMTLFAASRPSFQEVPARVTAWFSGQKARLAPDVPDGPVRVEALSIRAEPAQGVYTQASTTTLLAEPERETDEGAFYDPDEAATDAALNAQRYQQYLLDQGYTPADEVEVRERILRDANGNVIGKKYEIIVPERTPTR